MKVLIVGSGGREHAIGWKISKSPKVNKIYAAPGNPGMSTFAECVNIKVEDIRSLVAFAKQEAIDITVVGPELPLVLGIVDAFEAEGLKIFGPNKEASQFEGSKAFTKEFLERHAIPTAKYKTYYDAASAIAEVESFGYPVVVKADGLAAGKGVIIAKTKAEAIKAIEEIMNDKVFGESGDQVVLESFLTGIEASILCFVDGETILPMAPAQDYKKAYDNDEGLNTGGMGTYSPSRIIDDALMARIQTEILNPFITGIKKDNIAFKGILFVGVMIEGDEINVLEYNVRMGDPETEVTLPRMENDLIDVIEAVLETKLNEIELKWSKESAVCVIMASGGYPEAYEKGKAITGLSDVKSSIVFHCGTRLDGEKIVTNGGRVLGITALGDTIDAARQKAYVDREKISFEGGFSRMDIAKFNA
jgi:phosphoribosylamine--glycine ligase